MSKILSGIAPQDVKRWQLPTVEEEKGVGGGSSLLTANQLERIEAQAREEGYARGLEEGRKAGIARYEPQIKTSLQQFEAIMSTLAVPLVQLDDQVEQELLSLVLIIARHLVRRELSTDPGQVVAAIREALNALPIAARNVRLQLHPEDAALVRELLAESEGERAWRILEDPVISRGGCRVLTDVSLIDATVEKRLTAIAAELLGGERDDDNDAPR